MDVDLPLDLGNGTEVVDLPLDLGDCAADVLAEFDVLVAVLAAALSLAAVTAAACCM